MTGTPLPGDEAGSPCRSLTYRVHNGGWVCTSDWEYLIDEGRLLIPKGFRCDLASIPRPLRIIPGFGREELGVSAPVLHDWSYRHGGCLPEGIRLTRRRTDQLFLILMRCDTVGRIRAHVAWAAVRLFGWLAFRRLPSVEWALHHAD